MKKIHILILLVGNMAFAQNPAPKPAKPVAERFQLVHHPEAGKVDVLIDGHLFTAYVYKNEKLRKPVLYPIISATGQRVTRSFPLENAPDERIDSPAQSGLWFGYANVNGLDFWNSSFENTDKNAFKKGTVRHTKILNMKNGNEGCGLEVAAQWQRPDGTPLLFQNTKYIFKGKKNTRTIDLVITLSALDEKVNLEDDEGGLLGLRVCRELEIPVDEPVTRTDAAGKPGTEPVVNKKGITGNYQSDVGFTGEQVKGQKARWVKLSGKIKNELIDVIILDHPANLPHPPYWNVTAGGLFAVNPLGAKAFTNGEKYTGMQVPAGNSAIFRYHIIIQATGGFNPTLIESEFQKFAKMK